MPRRKHITITPQQARQLNEIGGQHGRGMFPGAFDPDDLAKLEQAERLRDTNERQLAEVTEGLKAVAAGQAANDKEKASLVKRMQRVAKREQSVEVGEQLTAVRAQLEAAGTELLDACDTVEKDLVGRSIAAALETLESVKV